MHLTEDRSRLTFPEPELQREGRIHHNDPRGFPEKDLEAIGVKLAEDAFAAIEKIEWRTPARISARAKRLALPYREPTEEEIRGTQKGAAGGLACPPRRRVAD